LTEQVTGLVKYDAMCSAIAECERVDEAKDIRDKAMALEKYFAQSQNLESERLALNVRLRAERRCGVLLREMRESGERDPGGRGPRVASNATTQPTISDLGLSRDQSSRFEQLAQIPEREFERALDEPVKQSTSGLIRKFVKTDDDEEKVDPQALYLWGRLRDFERELLGSSPKQLIKKMTPAMRDDVRRLVPMVIEYLEKA